MEESCVLRGVMVNKDVTHPRMRRLIKNPRIVLLDCSLEYKKGESQVHSLSFLSLSIRHTFLFFPSGMLAQLEKRSRVICTHLSFLYRHTEPPYEGLPC